MLTFASVVENDIKEAQTILSSSSTVPLSSVAAKNAILCLESHGFSREDIARNAPISLQTLQAIQSQWHNEVFYVLN